MPSQLDLPFAVCHLPFAICDAAEKFETVILRVLRACFPQSVPQNTTGQMTADEGQWAGGQS